MFLSIDIGNTNIDLGLFRNDRLRVHRKLPTASWNEPGTLGDQVRSSLAPHLDTEPLTGAAVGSVVSALGETLTRAVQPLCASPVLLARTTWDLGLTIDYDQPQRIGIDRLLAAVAAHARVPAGSGLVVADAGTALTVDAVDAAGVFLGGLVLPGPRLGLQALHSGTSLLPEIDLDPRAPLLGKNTRACMQAGALHGGAALIDGLFDRIATQLACPLIGFLTGGDAELLHPHLTRFTHCDPALVLDGLRLAHARQTTAPY